MRIVLLKVPDVVMVHFSQLFKGGIAGFWLVEEQVFLPLSDLAKAEQLPKVAK